MMNMFSFERIKKAENEAIPYGDWIRFLIVNIYLDWLGKKIENRKWLTDSRFRLFKTSHFICNCGEIMNKYVNLQLKKKQINHTRYNKISSFTLSNCCRTRFIGSSTTSISSSFSTFCWRSTSWCKLRTALEFEQKTKWKMIQSFFLQDNIAKL
jgi:hypothetical protein